eukprot:2220539-Amphidinium_carterae.2
MPQMREQGGHARRASRYVAQTLRWDSNLGHSHRICSVWHTWAPHSLQAGEGSCLAQKRR